MEIPADRKPLILSYVLGLATGAAVVFTIAATLRFEPTKADYREKYAAHTMINPLLECESVKSVMGTRVMALDQNLQHFLKELQTRHPGFQYSAYVRELVSGSWFGAGEDDGFYPGSLVKLPLAIGWVKASEESPSVLNKQIPITNDDIKLYDVQGVRPSQKIEAKKSYTVKELIRRALIYSDNAAAHALEVADQHQSLQRTAIELNVPIHTGAPPYRPISLREFSRFFLSLYNAQYISPENSNWILTLLDDSEYNDGIVAGVPKNLRVSHKFGEHFDESKTTHYLTDCGVIYAADSPYVLCATARGSSSENISVGLQEISKHVFEIFENAKKQAQASSN